MPRDLRYPIGTEEEYYKGDAGFTDQIRTSCIIDIQQCPSLLEHAVSNLDEQQLEVPYRDGGWTIRQVVHHVADSHCNAYIRFKLALTENNPAIKPYDESAWALMQDTRLLPINISLTLLHALHTRWVAILKNMGSAEWQRTIFHPEHKRTIPLSILLKSYAWHGKHHVAHITSLRERMRW